MTDLTYTTQTLIERATLDGGSHDIFTGILDLTTNSETPVLYLKNVSPRTLRPSRFVFSFATSTGSSGGPIAVRLYKTNKASGTLITTAPTAYIHNRNFSLDNPPAVEARVGDHTYTLLSGDVVAGFVAMPGGGMVTVPSEIVLPTNASLALTIRPPGGNSSMLCSVYVVTYLLD